MKRLIEVGLGRINIPVKLLLISVSFSFPIAVLLWFLVGSINSDVRFSQLEQWGNAYQRALEPLLEHIPDHGLLAQRVAAGEGDVRPALEAAEAEVGRAFAALEDVDRRLGEVLQFTDEGLRKRGREHLRVSTLRQEWETLRGRRSDLSPTENERQHRHLTDDVRRMITHAGDVSNLILDPDLDSYYTMDMTLLALPQTQDRLATVLGHAVRMLAGGLPAAEERLALAVEIALLREDLARIKMDGETALNEDAHFYGSSPSLQRNLTPALEHYERQSEGFLALISELAQRGPDALGREQLFRAGRDARRASFALWQSAAGELDALLATRLDHYRRARTRALNFTMLALAISILLAYAISANITRGLNQCVESVSAQATLDLPRRPALSSSDEIGRMGRDLNQALDGMSGAIEAIAESASGLAGASEELSAVSEQLSTGAQETAAQAAAVSTGAEQVSLNVGTVATATEQMGATINEVASNASQAAQVAAAAVRMAETANQTVSKLGRSSLEIGNVVKLITSIAEQTNLLALNATIEAARAGEAGRGFAVVATEVKELAKATTQATADIGAKIEAIQGDTRQAVEAIGHITAIISQISAFQHSIASAVEEQSVSTTEIGRNVAQAAGGSSEIARNVAAVADAVQGTTSGADEIRKAALELSRMACDLQRLVLRFKVRTTDRALRTAA
jgi:methyl-accepting chemotaxis protein